MRRAASSVTLLSLLLSASPALAKFGRPEAAPPAEESARVDLLPSPNLTPRQVVEVQLGGLGANTEWGDNRGIQLAYNFASPENQAMTGPFSRFAAMVTQGYGSLLDHRDADIGPIQVRGGEAYLPVIVTDGHGQQHGFVWVLRRQTRGRFADCWMTDAVFRAPLAAARSDEARLDHI